MITSDGSNKLSYKGQEIGEVITEGDRARVTLTISYECKAEDWILPVSWFAHGLALIEPKRPQTLLTVKMGQKDAAIANSAGPVFLTEKKLSGDGYVWEFHKSDADPWPSELHGHDYEQNLVIDAITCEIYDYATRTYRGRLKRKPRKTLHQKIRACPDLQDRVHLLPAK